MTRHLRLMVTELLQRGLLCVVTVCAFGAHGFCQTYSCGNGGSGHCYGVVSWQEQTEYFGAYTDIVRNSIKCPSGCGGFVDDELWLVDNRSADAGGNPFNQSWVEAGYIAVEGSDPVFFWADGRPLKDSSFNLHLLGSVDSVATNDHFMIIKDARQASDVFQVFIYNDSLSTLYNGTSTSNPMRGNDVMMGQELAGTKNASAADAQFSRNIWAVQALGPEYVFWYNRQTTKGSVTSANPPTASWAIDPASGSPEGGQFTTHCCQ